MITSALLANMVKEAISSGGTGNITMSGAVSGFNTFSDYFTDGPGVSYHLSEGADWETGVGHLTTTQTILVRDQILRKSVSGVITDLPATGMNITNSGFVSVRPNALMQSTGFGQNLAGGNAFFPPNLTVNKFDINHATADRMMLVPVRLLDPIIITNFGFIITTLDATDPNCRAGVYVSGPDGLPNTLLIDSGDIDTTATGLILNTLGSPVLLPAGFYWFAAVCGTTAVIFTGISSQVSHYFTNTSQKTSNLRQEYYHQSGITGALPAIIGALGTNNAFENPIPCWT